MKKNIFKRLVTLFLAVVLTMGLFAPMLTTEVEAASYEAWVGYCPYDRQIRNENGQKIGVKIPAGFEFIVIGVKKNDSTRYEVLFGPHKGNIDRSNVKEAKGTYIGYNTADRRIRDAYGGSLELIPAGSYFPCRGKTEFEPGRLLVVWATCEGSIAETCVKKVTEVKAGTSSTGSTGTGSAGGNNTGSTGGNNTGSTSTSDKGSTGSGSTKEPSTKGAWVGECPYDRRMRDANGNRMEVLIPANADFVVRGVKKDDSTRLEVWYEGNYGNIDKSGVKEVKGAYVAYNTAGRRMRDKNGASLDMIPAGSYFPCYGTSKSDSTRLDAAFGTCKGSILGTSVKKVTEVKAGTSSTGSTGTGSAGGNNTGSTSTSDKGSTGSGSTKEPSTKGAWVGECPYDRRMRDANGNRMEVLIPANADFVVRGVKKDDSTRLEVWYEGNYGNIDKSGVKEVKGAYVAYNTAGRRMRDKNGASLDMIPAGSYFPCYGTSKSDSTRLDAAFGTCKGSILGTSVKKVTEVKAGTSSTGSSGTSDKMPSTKGKTGYLVVNKNDFSIYMCYGKVEGDSTKVWVDTNFDGKIDKKAPRKDFENVDAESIIISVKDQMVYAIRNSKIAYKGNCITGKYNTRHETNRGIQEFVQMSENIPLEGIDSKGKPYVRQVSYWMQFNDDEEGIHDAKWRDPDLFGGSTYKYNGSLGCVNVPTIVAQTLYTKYASMNEQVIVTDSSLKGLK